MNWKLVAQLSLLGLLMGVGTVFFISSNAEPFFWLVVFAISAVMIASRSGGRYFAHGVLVGLANSVWVTACHVLLFNQYIAGHPKEAGMMASMPMPGSPRLMMSLVGPCIGLISGVIIGLLAVVASKFMTRKPAPAV